MKDWFRRQWCDLAHSGGHIKRDEHDRINWQCQTCGRWGQPVAADVEQRVVDADIMRAYSSSPRAGGSDD